MAIIKKYLATPNTDTQELYDPSLKQYCTDIAEMLEGAGLVKANVVGNIDLLNIDYPSLANITENVDEMYSTSRMYYDLNDTSQISTPVRIMFEFGVARYAHHSDDGPYYPFYNILKTTIGHINVTNNTMYNTIVFISGCVHTHSSGLDGIVRKSDANMESFIVYRDGFLAVCINPEYDETYDGNSNIVYKSPQSEFIIQRINDDINVYHSDTISWNSYATWVCTASSKLENEIITKYFLHIDLTTYLSKGRLITFPVFNYDSNGGRYEQSSDILICDKNAMTSGNVISVKVDGAELNRDFIALSSYNYGAIVLTSRMLVGID